MTDEEEKIDFDSITVEYVLNETLENYEKRKKEYFSKTKERCVNEILKAAKCGTYTCSVELSLSYNKFHNLQMDAVNEIIQLLKQKGFTIELKKYEIDSYIIINW